MIHEFLFQQFVLFIIIKIKFIYYLHMRNKYITLLVAFVVPDTDQKQNIN